MFRHIRELVARLGLRDKTTRMWVTDAFISLMIGFVLMNALVSAFISFIGARRS